MPFRGYAKICSDWFRDENLKSACHVYTDDTTRNGTNGNNYITDTELGGQPYTVAKMHDYFTSCLPSAQKGTPVSIPLGTIAPITGTATTTISGQGAKNVNTSSTTHTVSTYPVQYWTNTSPGTVPANNTLTNALTGTPLRDTLVFGQFNTTSTATSQIVPNNLIADVTGLTATTNISNLTADLSSATAATINQLRTAFAIQKYYETAARYGTRYIEYLRGIFGVTSSDARMQRAEYLGLSLIHI